MIWYHATTTQKNWSEIEIFEINLKVEKLIVSVCGYKINVKMKTEEKKAPPDITFYIRGAIKLRMSIAIICKHQNFKDYYISYDESDCDEYVRGVFYFENCIENCVQPMAFANRKKLRKVFLSISRSMLFGKFKRKLKIITLERKKKTRKKL